MQNEWRVQPSLKYDALCMVGILAGDPFYVRHYPRIYTDFDRHISPSIRAALDHLQAIIKGDGGIISASLCHLFSITDDETLADLQARLQHLQPIREAFADNAAYLHILEECIFDLDAVLSMLIEQDFTTYWESHILPDIQNSITDITPRLPTLNLLPTIEQLTGRGFGEQQITIVLLGLVKPHGIRIHGTRFLTSHDYPLSIILHNAIHELLHPPCDFEHDTAFLHAIKAWRDNPFVMHHVENHDPAFGYNSFEGYVEENIVQALDQLLLERLRIPHQVPRKRWQNSDGGMHVLAVALYATLKGTDFQGEPIREFIIESITNGDLLDIESTYSHFMDSK